MTEIRYGYADAGIGQVHYAEARDTAAPQGPALVLLNPRARSSLPMLRALHGFSRVVGFDLPGFGRSAPMPEGAGMADVATAIAEAAADIGIARAYWFGVNTGHKIAAAVAAHLPDRVQRLVILGRSHSLIPDRDARNPAMQAVIDENQPDMAIIRSEGRYLDEAWATRAFATMFRANFAFDFAAALRRTKAKTLILEIASPTEDRQYGRQAEGLASCMSDARSKVLPQTDPTGLWMYVGMETLVAEMQDFLL